MQVMFGPQSEWFAPWISKVLPVVTDIAARAPARTAFTRFIPPREPEDMPGSWQRYYQRWRHMTQERIDPEWLKLFPELARFAPPATVIDKATYSAFGASGLEPWLLAHNVDTLLITGSETDVCVLATVLAAVDRGYRVIIVTDAICSSSDQGHNGLMELYSTRFTEQVETATAAAILPDWPPAS